MRLHGPNSCNEGSTFLPLVLFPASSWFPKQLRCKVAMVGVAATHQFAVSSNVRLYIFLFCDCYYAFFLNLHFPFLDFYGNNPGDRLKALALIFRVAFLFELFGSLC